MSPPDETKQRVYDEHRSSPGSYKTVFGKADALQKVIGKDSEEGLVSGPFAESELRGKYHKVLLNSSGRKSKISQNRTSELWSTQPNGEPTKRFV